MKSLTKFKGAILSIEQALTDCAITCYFSLANEDECEEIQKDRFCEECEWYNRRPLVNQRRRDKALELSYNIYREEIRRGLAKIQRESGRRKEDGGHSDAAQATYVACQTSALAFTGPALPKAASQFVLLTTP